MGLHNEDWEWAQAATKSCGRNVLLPASLQTVTQRCSTPTKGRLCQIGASHATKQVERHHFIACFSLNEILSKFFKIFEIFDFSILNPTAGYALTSTHSFDIQTHFVAQYGPSDAPERVFIRDFLHRRRYIAVV